MKQTLSYLFFLFLGSCALTTDPTLPSAPPPSPYPTQIFDYQYGPGQHASSAGTKADQEDKFLGSNTKFVLLGGWGGYIVAGFDHRILNEPGYDLGIFTQSSAGAGSEPAVIYVMDDENNNGLPDDTWIELKGSEYAKEYGTGDKYVQNYQVTYHKPSNSNENITWEDNLGQTGTLVPGFGGTSSASWWWPGQEGTQVIFSGALLPLNKEYKESLWMDIPSRFLWGYGENYQGEDILNLPLGKVLAPANRFDLDDGVTSGGEPAHLQGFRFIKIQTGVFLQAGVLNEVSTEIRGAVDIHLLNNPKYSNP